LFACQRSEYITDDMSGIVETLVDEQFTDAPNLGARWLLATSRPEYRSGFNKYLRNPMGVSMVLNDQERQAFAEVEEVRAAWAEGTTTTGGFAVPADFDLTLMIQNDGSSNPFREISRNVQTTSNVWKGLGTAGVTAAYITESTEEGDDTPAVSQPSITVYRAGGYIQASFEVIQDSDLGSEVAALFADARANLEASVFATGTGGGQPWGTVTRATGLNAYVFSGSGSTVERDLVIGDIYRLVEALPERYQANASFVMNRTIAHQIRRFNEGSTGANAAFWTDLGPGIPSQLLGHPVYLSSAMDAVVASGSEDHVILYGDFKKAYAIVDRIGTSIAFNPFVVGSNRRPTGEVGWLAYWRNGADVLDQTSASGLKILHL
jgi:HK97 family phage major capsid protein